MQDFSGLNISSEVSKAIAAMGFTQPSPIQVETLPILMGDRTDFIGLAATGTGKTAAFGIPLIEKIDAQKRAVQGLILCPTRELALQVCEQINKLGQFKNVKAVAVYGGAGYAEQIDGVRRGAQIVVGTPGRLVDHVERGTIKLADVKVVVLDEADEMISMGFKEDLEKILSAVETTERQTWLFSATMSPEVRRVADTYLKTPKQVQVNRTEMLSSKVQQFYFKTEEGRKPELICRLIETADDFYGLIFCQTKTLVTQLNHYLTEKGYLVDCLHGDKDQNARERTLASFRARRTRILVCTDVAARGLDVKDITHVINYSLPRELDNYVHRIGRTARSGKSGIVFNLVTRSHARIMVLIERMTKSQMIEAEPPSFKDVATKKAEKLRAKFVANGATKASVLAAAKPADAEADELAERIATDGLDEKTTAKLAVAAPVIDEATERELINTQRNLEKAHTLLNEEWKTALVGLSSEEVAARFLTILLPEIGGQLKASAGTHSKTSEATVSAEHPGRPPGSPQRSGSRGSFNREVSSRFDDSGDSRGGRDSRDSRPSSSRFNQRGRPERGPSRASEFSPRIDSAPRLRDHAREHGGARDFGAPPSGESSFRREPRPVISRPTEFRRNDSRDDSRGFGGAGRPERPYRSERPERSERSERPERPYRSERPERSERPFRASAPRAEFGERPRDRFDSAGSRRPTSARPKVRQFGEDGGQRVLNKEAPRKVKFSPNAPPSTTLNRKERRAAQFGGKSE